MDASQLLNRPADVTRSTVQKAVVIIADSPQYFGMLRDRLSVVTKAWFAQREFTDVEILRRFQESLAAGAGPSTAVQSPYSYYDGNLADSDVFVPPGGEEPPPFTPYQAESVSQMPSSYLEKRSYRWCQYLYSG